MSDEIFKPKGWIVIGAIFGIFFSPFVAIYSYSELGLLAIATIPVTVGVFTVFSVWIWIVLKIMDATVFR